MKVSHGFDKSLTETFKLSLGLLSCQNLESGQKEKIGKRPGYI